VIGSVARSLCGSLAFYHCRYNKRREKLRIEPLYRNDSGVYACLTTMDQCQNWQNVTLVITGRLACLLFHRLHTLKWSYCLKQKYRNHFLLDFGAVLTRSVKLISLKSYLHIVQLMLLSPTPSSLASLKSRMALPFSCRFAVKRVLLKTSLSQVAICVGLILVGQHCFIPSDLLQNWTCKV